MTISGTVVLVHATPDRVEIIDYKIDQSRRAVSEYAVQLSVYYHVLESVYPDRPVGASLYFSEDDERIEIEPLGISELRKRAQEKTA